MIPFTTQSFSSEVMRWNVPLLFWNIILLKISYAWKSSTRENMDDIAFCPLHNMFPTKTGKIETIPQIIVILRGKSHYPWRFVSWLPGGVPVPLVYCPFRSWHLTTNAESLELLFSCLPSPLYILYIIFISWPPIAESLEILFEFLHLLYIIFISSIYPLNNFHILHLLFIIFISSLSFSYPDHQCWVIIVIIFISSGHTPLECTAIVISCVDSSSFVRGEMLWIAGNTKLEHKSTSAAEVLIAILSLDKGLYRLHELNLLFQNQGIKMCRPDNILHKFPKLGWLYAHFCNLCHQTKHQEDKLHRQNIFCILWNKYWASVL